MSFLYILLIIMSILMKRTISVASKSFAGQFAVNRLFSGKYVLKFSFLIYNITINFIYIGILLVSIFFPSKSFHVTTNELNSK